MIPVAEDADVILPGTEYRRMLAELQSTQQEVAGLREKVVRLEGALAPFGFLAEKWGVDVDDPRWTDDDIMLFANREGRLSEPPLVLTVGDFRLARAALNPQEPSRG